MLTGPSYYENTLRGSVSFNNLDLFCNTIIIITMQQKQLIINHNVNWTNRGPRKSTKNKRDRKK